MTIKPMSEEEAVTIERLIAELQRTDKFFREVTRPFSNDYAKTMPTEFTTTATMLKSYLRSGWRYPKEPAKMPEDWEPVAGDVWEDNEKIRWIASENSNGWCLQPSKVVAYEWISPGLGNEKSVPWFLARHPVLVLPSNQRGETA